MKPALSKTDRENTGLPGWVRLALSFCFLGLPLSAGVMLGVELAGGRFGNFVDESLSDLKQDLEQQQKELEDTKAIAEQRAKSLALKLATMQANLIRLNALGERLATMAELEPGEFDFSITPALGGPEPLAVVTDSGSPPSLENLYDHLLGDMAASEEKLNLLEALYRETNYRKEITLTGRPVIKGWMSSPYGYRVDPFRGTTVWHNGVDFAGKEGAGVVAVASGIVIKSGLEPGIGNVLEVDHGEGYITRYGHNKQNLVKAGDLVSKGQVIAAIGSTGRSTGPHVHFEVFKNGRSVDPATYIRRHQP